MIDLPALQLQRDALQRRMKAEPKEQRPFIRNVISTLDAVLKNDDLAEAATAQTLRNIETLKRMRRAPVACQRRA